MGFCQCSLHQKLLSWLPPPQLTHSPTIYRPQCYRHSLLQEPSTKNLGAMKGYYVMADLMIRTYACRAVPFTQHPRKIYTYIYVYMYIRHIADSDVVFDPSRRLTSRFTFHGSALAIVHWPPDGEHRHHRANPVSSDVDPVWVYVFVQRVRFSLFFFIFDFNLCTRLLSAMTHSATQNGAESREPNPEPRNSPRWKWELRSTIDDFGFGLAGSVAKLDKAFGQS